MFDYNDETHHFTINTSIPTEPLTQSSRQALQISIAQPLAFHRGTSGTDRHTSISPITALGSARIVPTTELNQIIDLADFSPYELFAHAYLPDSGDFQVFRDQLPQPLTHYAPGLWRLYQIVAGPDETRFYFDHQPSLDHHQLITAELIIPHPINNLGLDLIRNSNDFRDEYINFNIYHKTRQTKLVAKVNVFKSPDSSAASTVYEVADYILL